LKVFDLKIFDLKALDSKRLCNCSAAGDLLQGAAPHPAGGYDPRPPMSASQQDGSLGLK